MEISERGGCEKLIQMEKGFRHGVYIYKGTLTSSFLGESFGLPYKDLDTSKYNTLEELPVFEYGCDSSYSWSALYKKVQHKGTHREITKRTTRAHPENTQRTPREHPLIFVDRAVTRNCI